ncbi:unnamed protein product [Amoebophrya sp. A25]|nr:unnamed protein product [Amoebophrya sp. A25]|eukprot:GSA25T00010382001.1
MKFRDLPLVPLLRNGLESLGIQDVSPLQRRAFYPLLRGKALTVLFNRPGSNDGNGNDANTTANSAPGEPETARVSRKRRANASSTCEQNGHAEAACSYLVPLFQRMHLEKMQLTPATASVAEATTTTCSGSKHKNKTRSSSDTTYTRPSTLILVARREDGRQVTGFALSLVGALSKRFRLASLDEDDQGEALTRANVVVSTGGRAHWAVKRGVLALDQLRVLVCDAGEAEVHDPSTSSSTLARHVESIVDQSASARGSGAKKQQLVFIARGSMPTTLADTVERLTRRHSLEMITLSDRGSAAEKSDECATSTTSSSESSAYCSNSKQAAPSNGRGEGQERVSCSGAEATTRSPHDAHFFRPNLDIGGPEDENAKAGEAWLARGEALRTGAEACEYLRNIVGHRVCELASGDYAERTNALVHILRTRVTPSKQKIASTSGQAAGDKKMDERNDGSISKTELDMNDILNSEAPVTCDHHDHDAISSEEDHDGRSAPAPAGVLSTANADGENMDAGQGARLAVVFASSAAECEALSTHPILEKLGCRLLLPHFSSERKALTLRKFWDGLMPVLLTVDGMSISEDHTCIKNQVLGALALEGRPLEGAGGVALRNDSKGNTSTPSGIATVISFSPTTQPVQSNRRKQDVEGVEQRKRHLLESYAHKAAALVCRQHTKLGKRTAAGREDESSSCLITLCSPVDRKSAELDATVSEFLTSRRSKSNPSSTKVVMNKLERYQLPSAEKILKSTTKDVWSDILAVPHSKYAPLLSLCRRLFENAEQQGEQALEMRSSTKQEIVDMEDEDDNYERGERILRGALAYLAGKSAGTSVNTREHQHHQVGYSVDGQLAVDEQQGRGTGSLHQSFMSCGASTSLPPWSSRSHLNKSLLGARSGFATLQVHDPDHMVITATDTLKKWLLTSVLRNELNAFIRAEKRRVFYSSAQRGALTGRSGSRRRYSGSSGGHHQQLALLSNKQKQKLKEMFLEKHVGQIQKCRGGWVFDVSERASEIVLRNAKTTSSAKIMTSCLGHSNSHVGHDLLSSDENQQLAVTRVRRLPRLVNAVSRWKRSWKILPWSGWRSRMRADKHRRVAKQQRIARHRAAGIS